MSLSGYASEINGVMQGRKRQPELLGSILSRALRRVGLETKVKEQRVLLLWDEVVGEEISNRTKAVDFKNSRVFVEVRSATWRNELLFLKPAIIDRLNKAVGKSVVEDIIFLGGQGRRQRYFHHDIFTEK